MPDLKNSQTISETRFKVRKNFETPGVVPVSSKGKFSGVLISTGELDKSTAERLSQLLQRNHKAGIDEVLNIALAESQ
jgi:hypothetical protein